MRRTSPLKRAEASKAVHMLSKLAFSTTELEEIPAQIVSLGTSGLVGTPIVGPAGGALMDLFTAPEGRGASRAAHSILGGGLGTLAGAATADFLPKDYRLPVMLLGGAGGSFLGREASRESDPALMRLSRALGIERVFYR
jgi:hypothetical protein